MSYSEMLTASSDGQLSGYKEYRNSHGFLALIWDVLCKKYERQIEKSQGRSHYSMDAWPKLWAWVSTEPQPKLQPWEMNVLVMSYDRAFTQGKENLLIYADSLETFSKALVPGNDGRVNHLPQMAADLRLAVEEGAEYVAWYGMSVIENMFFIYPPDEEYEESEDEEHEEKEEDEEEDEGHMLCFLNEDDMKKIDTSLFKMVPLTEEFASFNDTHTQDTL